MLYNPEHIMEPNMKFEIINRADAHAQGLRRFYTGKPCKFGHDSQRFVTTGNCIECANQRSRRFAVQKNATDGKFVYPLKNQADHAAAWAYCQALDLARGEVPTPKPGAAVTSPGFDAVAAIHTATKGKSVLPNQSRELDPRMAEQLRAAGLLK